MASLVLMILDGVGVAPRNRANPRSRAETPTLDRLEREAFAMTLQASGVGVGLPWGEPGNSEAGHLTIGAGRLLYHHLPRIIVAIRDGSFFKNPALLAACNHVKRTGGKLHAMGLVSSGSVHAYLDHYYALFELAKQEGVPLVLHAFSDGRDALPQESVKLLPGVDDRLRLVAGGRIATICGRHFAMDRDGHWDRTRLAYRLLTEGEGEAAASLVEGIERHYRNGATDETIPPTIIARPDGKLDLVQSGDALVFMNFREDSARQLSQAFAAKTFSAFPRVELRDFLFVTMTEYVPGIGALVAFPPIEIRETLGEMISLAGLTQLRIAETEKYAHVTYFFNGGVEPPFPREDRVLIPSISDVEPDATPVMRAFEIADTIIQAVEKRSHDVIIANFANGDMVGHTGNFRACVEAFEALDGALAKVLRVLEERQVPTLITADHGNIEEKIDLFTGRPLTEHSLNPIPFFALVPRIAATSSGGRGDLATQQPSGLLTDIAPTALALLGIPKPAAMTGRNLLAAA